MIIVLVLKVLGRAHASRDAFIEFPPLTTMLKPPLSLITVLTAMYLLSVPKFCAYMFPVLRSSFNFLLFLKFTPSKEGI